jgi:hypothetical protein
VNAKVGEGSFVRITEETDYPFEGKVVFKIKTDKKVEFPLYLRIPGWAEACSIEFKGEKMSAGAGETVALHEKWEDGDTILLQIPFELRSERRYNNSVSLLRGPLYYSLRIEKDYSETEMSYRKYDFMGVTDWQIKPLTDWNYGLLLDVDDPGKDIRTESHPLAAFPWADKGDVLWSAEENSHIIWDRDAPVVLKVKGIKLPGWGMKDNSAADPPYSPVSTEGEVVELELVPYGSAKLRITEFPLVRR